MHVGLIMQPLRATKKKKKEKRDNPRKLKEMLQMRLVQKDIDITSLASCPF